MIDRRIGKIRIRRGTDAQRKSVIFPEGELVYSIDKKKIYVGNDTQYGGILISNKNFVVDVLGSPQIPEDANYGSLIHEISTKKTYLVGYDTDKTTLKLFTMFDLNGSEIQINIDNLKQRLSAVEECLKTKPPEPPKNILTWVTQPSDIYIDEHQTATFTASATYTSPVTYAWFRSDKNTIHSGSTTNYTLIISDAQLADGVAYYCVASSTDVASITSNIATLHVNELPPVLVGPSIVTHPKSQTTKALVPVTFTIDAIGSAPLAYQWMIDGVNVVGATGVSYTLTNPTKNISITCKVSNSVGDVTSNIAQLTIVTPPAIITQPKSQTAEPTTPVTFTIDVTGSSPITYQWMIDGVNVSGATSSSFRITNPTKSVSVTCRVSNSVGNVTSNIAELTFGGVPYAVDIYPKSQTVVRGNSVTISVTSLGAPPLTYQWVRDFVENKISGATSSSYTFTIRNDYIGTNSYFCIVSNSFGSTVSTDAIVVATWS